MRKILVVLSLSIFFFLSANSVWAIGITPPDMNLNYEPGETVTLSFGIGNFGENMGYATVFSGEYAKNVQVIREDSGSFTVDFTFPEKATPGPHEVLMGITQVPKGDFGSDGAIHATARVYSRVKFRVPYPAKYAEIELESTDAAAGEMAYFTVNVRNYGKEDIKKLTGTIAIIDQNNQTVTQVPLSEREELASLQKTEMFAQWDSENQSAGVYKIIATVNYDGILVTSEAQLRLGVLSVNIKSIRALGNVGSGVVKINLDIASSWNGIIKNVYADGDIFRNSSNIASLKSATIELPPWTDNTLVLYWDVYGLDVGIYDLEVLLHYENSTKKTTTQIYLMEEEETEEEAGPNTLLYGAIMVLALALIFLIIVIAHMMRGHKDEE